MKLIRGKKIASEILGKLRVQIKKSGAKPRLAVILVGKNEASKIYINLKAKAAKKVGINFSLYSFKAKVKEKEILKLIKLLNRDKATSGIIVQLPLPGKLKTDKIINFIKPEKDADGFHPEVIKEFFKNEKKQIPVFPGAIIKILESIKVNLKGKRGIVIANSELFGKIMSQAMKRKGIRSEYLVAGNLKKDKEKIARGDIIITALGKPGAISGEMVKRGAIIVDGGITKKSGKTLGDVDFNSVVAKAAYLSPVPGGVGPVTVACLLENVYKLAVAGSKNK